MKNLMKKLGVTIGKEWVVPTPISTFNVIPARNPLFSTNYPLVDSHPVLHPGFIFEFSPYQHP